MTKIKLNLKELILDVDFTEKEKGSRTMSNETIQKINSALLKEIEKNIVSGKYFQSVSIISEDRLTVAKVGDIVENPNSKFDVTRYGVVVKINSKTIDVVFKNGVLRGTKESFKPSDKTPNEILWKSKEISMVGFVGQFGKFKYQGESYTSLIVDDSRGKISVVLFDLNNKVLKVEEDKIENYFTLIV